MMNETVENVAAGLGAASPRPWRFEEHRMERGDGISYIAIVGSNGEAVCDLFPHGARAGVGVAAALANARLICAAVNGDG